MLWKSIKFIRYKKKTYNLVPRASHLTALQQKYQPLVPRVSHLTALWGERGETLVWSGHVLL